MRWKNHSIQIRDMKFSTGFSDPSGLLDEVRKNEFGNYFFCSASTVVNASRNPELVNILRKGVAIPDSTPLAWILTGSRNCVIRGTSFTRFLLSNMTPEETIFLIGSTSSVLTNFEVNALKMNPKLKIVGFQSPSFSNSIEEKVNVSYQQISSTRPSYVLVALSSPQQDLFIHLLSQLVPGRYFAVGAAFDFIANSKREAPHWLQKTGLEWIFRLVMEPKRLWKRYFFDNSIFIVLSVNHLISRFRKTDK